MEDETEYLDNDAKKVVNGFAAMEDMFEKYSKRKFNPDKDTILNPVYQQAQQQAMYGGEGMNNVVDEETGDPDEGVKNPYDEFDKSMEGDPIWKATKDWLTENKIKV